MIILSISTPLVLEVFLEAEVAKASVSDLLMEKVQIKFLAFDISLGQLLVSICHWIIVEMIRSLQVEAVHSSEKKKSLLISERWLQPLL